MKDTCLVLEGGGLRGAFTSGVLEFFLENDVHFNRIVGVSAGACIGASYMSRQKGRNWKVYVEYPSDRRFMGWRHLLTKGCYFNTEFLYDDIPNRLVPYNEKAFYSNPVEYDIVATCLNSGESVVFSKRDIERVGLLRVILASSSLPLMSAPVEIDGKCYLDGGVKDSIPVRYALSRHKKAVVVLTRPRGYRKGKLKGSFLLKLAFRKYPDFVKTILKRNEEYNRTLDFCEQMEKEGLVMLLAPSADVVIGRTEHSRQRRENAYHHGYALMKEGCETLQRFLETDYPS